jgi:hypothetical protein
MQLKVSENKEFYVCFIHGMILMVVYKPNNALVTKYSH